VSPDSSRRRAVRATALVLAALCGAWMLLLWALGGFDTRVLGVRLTTHEPLRPLLAGAAALSVYLLAGGAVWLPDPRVWSVAGRWIMRVGRSIGGIDHRAIVGALALAVLAAGVDRGTYTAGGSDSYGYLSEVNLWLRGNPVVAQPWANDVPWPNSIQSFSPMGYRPKGPDAIVPTYPAGLPLLMAAAQTVAGHCAVFWITPILGAVFVIFTWLLGRRLGSSRGGVIAAWLVATSSPMLFMLIVPLTDVPVAAVWTVAWYLLLGPGVWSAAGAGLVAGFASLIRPNLAPLAGLFVLWKIVQLVRGASSERGPRFRQLVAVGVGLLPGALALAAINQHLYGSPLLTGYGSAAGYFALSHVPQNVKNYWSWFLETETPVAVLGLIALVLPLKRVWTNVPDRGVIVFGALFVFGLWAQYQAFLVFDAWWFIRFLLPCWPFILIGTGRVIELAIRPGWPITAVAVFVVVTALGLRGLGLAMDNGTFDAWRGEHKYVTVGQLAGSSTEENSVLLSMQHSGSIRYYGGRMTIRYEWMQPGRVDQDMAWLGAHGAHPYALLEDWEADALRASFAGTATGQRLKDPPVFVYDGPSKTILYDLLPSARVASDTRVYVEDYTNARCVPPAPLPRLILK
jgi:hypothetical protein